MKRHYAIIAAMLAMAPAVASAQVYQDDTTYVERRDRGWGIALKGGVSWNNVDDSGVFPGDLDQFTGWTLGLAIGTTGEPVSVGLEALWARRGLTLGTDADSRTFDYIDVPAMLRIAIPAGAIAPYLFAGPQLSWEVSCETGTGSCSGDRDELSYAAIIGAGVRLGDASRFSIEGRYMYGLSDFDYSTVTSSSSYRQRNFMILGGVGF
jgi:hypothetical protein